MTGTDVTFSRKVDGEYDLVVNASGVTTFGGAIGGTTGLAGVTTDAAGTTAIDGGGITTTGAQVYHDGVTLGADTTLTGSTVTFNGTVAGVSHGLSILGAGVFGDGPADTVTGVTNLSVSGAAGINTDTVTTTGTQSYGGDVTLGSDVTVTGTDVTFSRKVDGEYDLVVNASGVTTFGGAVGGHYRPCGRDHGCGRGAR